MAQPTIFYKAWIAWQVFDWHHVKASIHAQILRFLYTRNASPRWPVSLTAICTMAGVGYSYMQVYRELEAMEQLGYVGHYPKVGYFPLIRYLDSLLFCLCASL